MLTVVVGPPCAGKSTYIRRMARAGGVLVDYDALACALALWQAKTTKRRPGRKAVVY